MPGASLATGASGAASLGYGTWPPACPGTAAVSDVGAHRCLYECVTGQARPFPGTGEKRAGQGPQCPQATVPLVAGRAGGRACAHAGNPAGR